jgi:hypothetical protein
VSNPLQIVGDYTNPILKPEAAAVVKKFGEMSIDHYGFHNPRNQCWPNGLPFILSANGMEMFQQPDKIIMIYQTDHQIRHVRMNAQHPAKITPSWYGDSVGHYEGDTLVIDTVGIKAGPFAMVDGSGRKPGSARRQTISAAGFYRGKGLNGRQRECSSPATGSRSQPRQHLQLTLLSRMKTSSRRPGRDLWEAGARMARTCLRRNPNKYGTEGRSGPTADKPVSESWHGASTLFF